MISRNESHRIDIGSAGISHASKVGIALIASLCGLLAITSPGSADDSADAGDLEIVVTNFESDKGFLVVGLLNSAAQYDAENQMFRSDTEVAIRDGVATVTYEGLPFGSYAVKVFHDENTNAELDTNFVGFPKEGFGFSNNAMGKFGPPSFEQARFDLATKKLRIEINLN